MHTSQQLLDRLNEIGASLAETGAGLALIGLGSVGIELDRLDAYSDLDFFAIVKEGHKARFVDRLDWLAAPLAYAFRNTVDGYKILFEDGVFAEMAVFEPGELADIPFAPGRIVWKADSVDEGIGTPVRALPPPADHPVEFHVGEALTNLYVGLGRFRRGEKLSAFRFVQGHAVDHVLRLAQHVEAEQAAHVDPFAIERRFELRFPDMAADLPRFMQGYDRTPESAREILAFLDTHFEVNGAIKAAIVTLCDPAG